MAASGISFRVTGRVQGVWFRKYTSREAKRLGLTGHVRNEADGSVTGKAFGSSSGLRTLREWLRHTGSPKSRIESATFTALKGSDTKIVPSVFEIQR